MAIIQAIKTAVAYIRVSKLKKDHVSPSAQLQMMRDWCERNGVQLVEVFHDLDISGREYARHKRDDLQRMIERVREGDIDYVLCYRFDRLTRGGSRDYYRIIEEFGGKAHVVSISENIDTSTAIGEIVLNLYLGQAKAESERIGERVRDTLTHIVRHKRKWIGGSPPIGYDLSKEGLVPNEHEAEIVRWIFEQYAAGVGTRRISKELEARAIPPPGKAYRWHYSSVNNILSSRVYIGEIKWQKEWHPGNHEPIIDEALFNRVQRMKAGNSRVGAPPTGERILTGLLRCGLCGKPGTIKHTGGSGWEKRIRYWCSTRHQIDKSACRNIGLDEPSLVEAVRGELVALADPQRVQERERRLKRKPRRDVESEIKDIDRRLARIKGFLDRLFVDHYEREAITHEQFVEQNRRYLAEQKDLLERRDKLASQATHTLARRGELRIATEASTLVAQAWDVLPPSERRIVVNELIREIVWTPKRAEILWAWGAKTPLEYHGTPLRTGYFDDRWMHPCPRCGFKAKSGAGLAKHMRSCSEVG